MQRARSCATARKDGSKHSTDGPNDAGMWKYIGLELYRLVNLNCDVLGEIMYWIVGALAQQSGNQNTPGSGEHKNRVTKSYDEHSWFW